MSARPTAAEIADRFVNGADLTYAQRAALVQDYKRALVAEDNADAYGARVLPVQDGAR